MSDFTTEPKSATTISSAELADHFKDVVSVNDRVKTLYTQTNTGLTLTIIVGEAYISGYKVGKSTDTSVAKSLTASQTNHVFLDRLGNITVNTTGTPPSESLKLFIVTTNGSAVTAVDSTVQDTTTVFNVATKSTKHTVTTLTPTGTDELTSKTYVDAQISAAGNLKLVRVASTANLTLSGTQTIDGVAVVASDRVLAKDQTTQADRGIYVVASGAWTRSADFAVGAITAGTKVAVAEGTANADTTWMLTTDGTITVGTTSLTFSLDSVQGQKGTSAGLATLTSGVHTAAERPAASTTVIGDALVGTATPAAVGTAAVGASTTRWAREDHVHAHGDQATSNTMHATAVASGNAGFLSGADKQILDDATSAATANKLMKRDGSGNTSAADGTSAAHVATKGQMDTAITGAKARANHTGTQTAATISDFDTQVRTSRLDQMAQPTASVPMNGQKLTGLGAPSGANDSVRLTDLGGGTHVSEWTPAVMGPFTNGLRSDGSQQNTTAASGIGRSSNGQVVVIAAGQNTGAFIAVWLSTDGGRTWTKTSAKPTAAVSSIEPGGMVVYVTDANTFSIAYWTNTTIMAFAKTTDGGGSWTTNTKTVANTTQGSSGVVITGIDTAVWIFAISTTSMGYNITTNAGSTFTNGTIATETVSNSPRASAVASLDGVTIFAFWYNAGKIRWSKSTNSGSTWAAAADLATDATTANSCFALQTSANKVILTYHATLTGASGSGTYLKVLRTTDGSSWSAAFDNSSLGCVVVAGDYPILAYDGTTLIVMQNVITNAFPVLQLWASLDEGATRSFTSGMAPSMLVDPTVTARAPMSPFAYLYGNKMLSVWPVGVVGVTSVVDTRKAVFLA